MKRPPNSVCRIARTRMQNDLKRLEQHKLKTSLTGSSFSSEKRDAIGIDYNKETRSSIAFLWIRPRRRSDLD